jgi:hypothetical protein
MKYSLGVPFTERFFELALTGQRPSPCRLRRPDHANSFMKREFGSKLIEQVLPRLDLTHVIDTSGAYIPGHGTPTVILLRPPSRRCERLSAHGDGHQGRTEHARRPGARAWSGRPSSSAD